ncbi:hypothetical protein GCM10012279_36140 [Micromonospora yangpuensis]|nr:hypothetical protein GCM10012279_36140 [Micromonospora yangpuensis]
MMNAPAMTNGTGRKTAVAEAVTAVTISAVRLVLDSSATSPPPARTSSQEILELPLNRGPVLPVDASVNGPDRRTNGARARSVQTGAGTNQIADA